MRRSTLVTVAFLCWSGAALAGPRVAISQVSIGHGKRVVAKVRAPLARYQPGDFSLVVDGGKPVAATKVDDYSTATGEQLSVVMVAQATPTMLTGPAVAAGADVPEALKALLPAGPEDTEFALVTYGQDATLRQGFTRRGAYTSLSLSAEADGTNLDAALHKAIYALVPRAGRKVIVVIGDGDGALAPDVKSLLQQNDIELYAMVLSTDAAAAQSPLVALDDLGEVSLLTPELLKGKADNLRHMLDWYYVVEFPGDGLPLDGGNHKLVISARTASSGERVAHLASAGSAPVAAAPPAAAPTAAPTPAAIAAPAAPAAEHHGSMMPAVVGGGLGLSLVIIGVVVFTRRKKHLALVGPAAQQQSASPVGTPTPSEAAAARGATLAITPGTVGMSPIPHGATKAMIPGTVAMPASPAGAPVPRTVAMPSSGAPIPRTVAMSPDGALIPGTVAMSPHAAATKALDVSGPAASASTMFMDPGLAAWLVPMNGPRRDQTLQLAGNGTTTVGSAGTCTVVIADPAMSKLHARIVADSGKFTIMDAGSRNGVVVNGKKVQSMVLTDNDTVKLGDTELRFKSTR